MPFEYKAVDVKCGCFNFFKRRYRVVDYREHQVKPTAAIQQQQQVNRGGSNSSISADQYRISEVRSITEMDSEATEAAYWQRPYRLQEQQDPRHFHHNYYLEPAHYHHPPANYYISPPEHQYSSSRQLTPQFYYNNNNGGSSSSGSYSGGGRYSSNFLALPPASSTAEQGIVKVDYDNFPNQSYAGCTVW